MTDLSRFPVTHKWPVRHPERLQLYSLPTPNGVKVSILLEELGLPYEIKHYQRDSKTMLAPPELRAVHPLGKSPVITDGEATVAESGAIIEYLIDRHGNGRLRPAIGTPSSRPDSSHRPASTSETPTITVA